MKRLILLASLLSFVLVPMVAQTDIPDGAERVENMLIPDGDGYITVEGFKIKVTDPFHVRQTKFTNNWYVGVQAGARQSWGSFTSNMKFLDKIGPSAALVIGKEITPISEIRAQLLYGRSHGMVNPALGLNNSVYDFNSAGFYLAYMPNITNILFKYKETRFLNVKGVIGIGLESSWGYSDWYKPHFDYRHTLFADCLVGLQAGLNVGFRLNDRVNLTVEAVETFLDDSFDHNRQHLNHTWDGHLNLHVGLTYHLGKNQSTRHFTFVRNEVTTLTEMNDTLNKLRDANKYLVRNPKHIQKVIKTDAEVIYTLIAFDDESSFVDRMQQTNIYNTAAIWERRQDSRIFICDENGVDNKLYRDRVAAIKHVLDDRYKIPESQIVTVADEKEVEGMMEGKTAIIFIINH